MRGEWKFGALITLTFLVLSGPSLLVLPSQSAGILVLTPIWLFFAHAKWKIAYWHKTLPVWLLAFWLALTVLWSAAQISTLIDSVVFLGTTCIAWIIANVCRIDFISRWVAMSSLAALCLSIGYSLAWPELGLVTGTYQTGAFQGIYPHRNILAFTLAIGIASAFTAPMYAFKRKYLRWILIVVLFGGLLATRSSTALLVTIAILAVGSLFRLILRLPPSRRMLPLLLGLSLIVSSAVIVDLMAETIIKALGRDVTLTGRTGIWELVIEHGQSAPIGGYGWGAVWGGAYPVGNQITADLGFYIDHAHNGYLDLFLQAGIVSLIILAGILLAIIGRGISSILRPGAPIGLWCLSLVLALVMYDAVETRITRPLGWAILVMALVFIHKERRISDRSVRSTTYSISSTLLARIKDGKA